MPLKYLACESDGFTVDDTNYLLVYSMLLRCAIKGMGTKERIKRGRTIDRQKPELNIYSAQVFDSGLTFAQDTASLMVTRIPVSIVQAGNHHTTAGGRVYKVIVTNIYSNVTASRAGTE